jgi:hypothetical protein
MKETDGHSGCNVICSSEHTNDPPLMSLDFSCAANVARAYEFATGRTIVEDAVETQLQCKSYECLIWFPPFSKIDFHKVKHVA